MKPIRTEEIERYLKTAVGPSARIRNLKALGDEPETGDVKRFGYGVPLLIDYMVDSQSRRAVLHTVSPSPFGHEHMADRAQALLWSHSSFNNLPLHVRSLDVGAFRNDGTAVSLGDAEEFFLFTEYVEGHVYAEDLVRMRDDPAIAPMDVARADRLTDYLVGIHQVQGQNRGLYVRRIRDLIGHAECVMGLIDTYPADFEGIDRDLLKNIELQCVEWRWKLKDRTHRLRQVHGDFHPWNILFGEGTEFSLLDRSRGEWGEPADDITSLTMNFLFFSLQRSGRLDGHFEMLFQRCWERYLSASGDREILEVAAPFFAFRGLVMAHPVWYPELDMDVRRKLFTFMQNVLREEVFKPEEVNGYCGA